MALPQTKEMRIFKDPLKTKMEKFELKGLTKGVCYDAVIWDEPGIMDACIWEQKVGSELTWDMTYNIFTYIIEGDFQLTDRTTHKKYSWEKGDLVFVPVGSRLIFRTKGGGKMLYFSHPPFSKMFEIFSLKGTEIEALR
ncbi:MAG TPA: cupin domain-containing protein [Nitrososphaerales archaeon]|nr:cupin domain-containing protein [Nitrososphaerales archaeon]